MGALQVAVMEASETYRVVSHSSRNSAHATAATRQRAAGEDALAAPEAVEHRKDVAQLTAEARQKRPQGAVPAQTAEEEAAQQARRHGLAHVAGDDQQGVFGTVGAVEVGQARIAAAVLPHIVLDDEVADHYRAVETT